MKYQYMNVSSDQSKNKDRKNDDEDKNQTKKNQK